MQRESFEIIRILADELPEKQIFIYDAQDRKTFKTIVLSPKTAIATPAKNRKFHSTDTQYFADMESEFNKGWDWDFPEAVFQSGMLLPEFNQYDWLSPPILVLKNIETNTYDEYDHYV